MNQPRPVPTSVPSSGRRPQSDSIEEFFHDVGRSFAPFLLGLVAGLCLATIFFALTRGA